MQPFGEDNVDRDEAQEEDELDDESYGDELSLVSKHFWSPTDIAIKIHSRCYQSGRACQR